MKRVNPRRIKGEVSLLQISGFGYEGRWPDVRTRYASIDHLASRMGYHRYLVISPQGRIVAGDCAVPREGFWLGGFYTSYEVFDSDDVLIPAHVVLDDLAAISRDDRAAYEIRCWKRRGWLKPPSSYFRNGPLPGSRRRLRRPKDYKHIGTFAEVRAAAALEADADSGEPTARIRGKRSRSLIGDNDWEGVWSFRGSDRSWKRHRKAQWKT
ncbi:hypothetical protein D3C71_174490 [compost metagenome]